MKKVSKEQQIATVYQQNWMVKLLSYQSEVVYKLGPENKADSLSRWFDEGELKSITSFPICYALQFNI